MFVLFHFSISLMIYLRVLHFHDFCLIVRSCCIHLRCSSDLLYYSSSRCVIRSFVHWPLLWIPSLPLAIIVVLRCCTSSSAGCADSFVSSDVGSQILLSSAWLWWVLMVVALGVGWSIGFVAVALLHSVSSIFLLYVHVFAYFAYNLKHSVSSFV